MEFNLDKNFLIKIRSCLLGILCTEQILRTVSKIYKIIFLANFIFKRILKIILPKI